MPIDTSLMSSAPPRNTRARATAAPRKTLNESRNEAVSGIFQLVGFGCVVTGNYADAAAIGMHADPISGEIVKLGAQNEQIGKGIDYLNQVGPYAGLISAVMPLVLQLLANHGRLDASKVPGLSSPQVLEAKVKAQMATQAAEEMRQAKQAQDDFDKAMIAMQDAQMAGQNGQQST